MSSDPHAMLRAKIEAGRKLLRMNQKELADQLGITVSKLSRAESGDTKSGDILLEIKHGMEKLGVGFTQNGVELIQDRLDIIEGEGCYRRLLDEIHTCLMEGDNRELLIMFASDKASPPPVMEKYRLMRKAGITMRQLIMEGDSYIMGKLKEYRTIPEKYFTNIVTVIYGNNVAQVNGDETRIVVYHDARLAERERKLFSYFWDTGKKPRKSTAAESYEG